MRQPVRRTHSKPGFSPPLISLIASYLRKWEPTKAVVIVKSSSPDVFSIGTNRRALVEGHIETAYEFYREQYRLAHLIGSYEIPYVALMNGLTMGCGLGLAVQGKYRVATERTAFRMPDVAIGTVPDAGASYFLSRLEGRFGLYLGMTGTWVRGRDTQKSNIATHYCEADKLPQLERQLISCCSNADVARVMAKYYPPDTKTAHSLSRYMEQINLIFDADSVDSIVSFLKRDETDWSRQTLLEFKSAAPTSLKVAHRQIKAGQNLNLLDCMKMDYRVSCREMDEGDFTEGVRSQLIDKDNRPKWKVARIEDVTEAHIRRFFEPFPSPRDELRPIR